MTFDSEDWDVRSASNGREALDVVETSDPFDAVVFDLEMPVMDGRTLCGELQRVTPRAAVVIVSGHGALQAKEDLGADAAFEKPFDAMLLAAEVRRLVPLAAK
jgi:CheY-like chemotaxis protein